VDVCRHWRIDLDPDRPGYKHIIMRPRSGGGLTHAAAELYCMYGKIQSAWARDNDNFAWRITVPTNTTATVYVPANDLSRVTESGHPVDNSEGVTFLRMEAGCAVFALQPGAYTFSSVIKQEVVQK